jgi:uncharacterized OB-fold protein
MTDLDRNSDEPFWVGAKDDRLLIQKCGSCGYLRWPPGPLCTECQSADTTWTEVRPEGVLETYATYHRALDQSFKNDVPYTIGLIHLCDGPRLFGKITDPAERLAVGQRLRASFEALKDGRPFPVWTVDRGLL